MRMHENSRPCLVQASTVITCDSYFGPICHQELQEMTSGHTVETNREPHVIQVTVLNKILISRTKSQKPWYVYLQSARDIFEQNLQLYRSRDGHVFIRSTKTIHEGDEMRYWFDDKLAREMNVPYLTPSNIIGICRYICHVCHKVFAHPNPLKFHIMNHSTDIGGTVLTASPWIPRNNSSASSDFKIDQFNHISSPFSIVNHSKCDHSNVDYDPDIEKKIDMKPKTAFVNNAQSLPRYTLTASIELVPSSEYSPGRNDSYRQKCDESKTACCANIELEEREPMELLNQSYSLVSSKKGHLCVFCGKLYSRKYGLKIHLRTHTGYKPLRCKYCFRAFGDPSNLNKHIRLHAQGSTPYQCTYCNKVLVRRRDLVRHLKSRHADEVTKA